jgi:pilus assembly protein FimV
MTVLSVMGQPLKAELEVTRLATSAFPGSQGGAADAFRQAGIDYSPALANLRFSRDVKERGGRRYLEVSSDRPLNEPFIDMLVELSWASGGWFASTPSCSIRPGWPKMPPAPVAAPEVKTPPAPAKPAEKAAAVPAESRPVVDSRPAVEAVC